jgi:homeobox-leucine zipper protein
VDWFFCCKIQALRYLRQVAHEDTHSVITGWGRQPAALRALSQKLTRLGSWTVPTECWWFLSWIFFSNSRTSSFTFYRGFNEALNGLADDGWSVVESDGVDDVCISVNSSPSKVINCNATFNNGLPVVSSSVLCAKASMLLQVNFTLQLEFLFIFTLSEHSAFFSYTNSTAIC